MPDEGVVIRAARQGDRRAARSLIEAMLGGTQYLETPIWALDQALENASRESRALVAEHGGDFVGLALYGEYAGARGAGRATLVVVTAGARLRRIGLQLLGAAHDELYAGGARFVLAEVPDDAISRPGWELLDRCGYVEEGRVDDFYRPGVALVLMRHERPDTA